MKIAFRISNMGFGGAERVFLSIAEELARAHQAEIQFVVDDIAKGETAEIVSARGFKLVGLDCSRTVTSIIPLKNYLNIEKPTILISAYTDTNMAALLSAKLAKHPCKMIVSEHASLKEHWQYKSWVKRLLLNAFVRFGYRLADHILCVSKGIEQQVIAMGNAPDKVSHIHNPVRFSPASAQKSVEKNQPFDATLLAVGRIAVSKDYLTLLHAFKLVRQEKNCRLVIVGGIFDNAEKSRLDAFIAENNLAPWVEFAGFSEHVQAYFASADVFVLSSAWEGFGNVIVEALAFGLPVVSTDCNHGPAEILQDGKFGQLIPVGDWQAMAKALINAISTKDIINKERLKARSTDFSEANITKQYWALIQKTVNQKI